MKKKTIFLLALSVILITVATMHGTLAYFTTYAGAEGGYTIRLGSRTTIHEDFYGWSKYVTIINDPNSQPVYVRAKYFAGSKYTLVCNAIPAKDDDPGNGVPFWKLNEDGYIYYSAILHGGETTTELIIEIENIPSSPTESNGLNVGDSFNVVVIYETTPVLYDGDGQPYADWNVTLDSGSSGNGEGGSN